MEKEQVFSPEEFSVSKETKKNNLSLLVYRVANTEELHNLELGYISPSKITPADVEWVENQNTFCNKGLNKYFYFYAEDAFELASIRNCRNRGFSYFNIHNRIVEFDIPIEFIIKYIGLGIYPKNKYKTYEYDEDNYRYSLEFSIPYKELMDYHHQGEKNTSEELIKKGLSYPILYPHAYIESKFVTGRIYKVGGDDDYKKIQIPEELQRKSHESFNQELAKDILDEFGVRKIISCIEGQYMPLFERIKIKQPNIDNLSAIIKNL